MAIWLGAWAGDNAGPVVGRQSNRALIALTHSDGSFPAGLFQRGSLAGVPWYYEIYVSCLTPGTKEAMATDVSDVGDYTWSIEIAEVDWGNGKASWEPGVHLFSIMLLAPGGHQTGVIATIKVDESVTRIDASKFGIGGFGGRRMPFPR